MRKRSPAKETVAVFPGGTPKAAEWQQAHLVTLGQSRPPAQHPLEAVVERQLSDDGAERPGRADHSNAPARCVRAGNAPISRFGPTILTLRARPEGVSEQVGRGG